MRLRFDNDEEKALFARRLNSGTDNEELIAAAERYFNGPATRTPPPKPPPRLTAQQYEQLQERLNDPWDTLYAGAVADSDDPDPHYYGRG